MNRIARASKERIGGLMNEHGGVISPEVTRKKSLPQVASLNELDKSMHPVYEHEII